MSINSGKELQNIPEFNDGYQEFLVNNSGDKSEENKQDSPTPRLGRANYLEQSNVIRISVNTHDSSSAKKSQLSSARKNIFAQKSDKRARDLI